MKRKETDSYGPTSTGNPRRLSPTGDVYVTEEALKPIEARYGSPSVLHLVQEIGPQELAMVRGSQKDGRAHDVTLFITDGPHVALIRKPFFPPGAWRAPSGGVRPGEDFEAGVLREAREETGLKIALRRYLLRVEVTFTCDEDGNEEAVAWVSHVFSARRVGGELGAQDTEEIAAVRWGTLEELQGPIRRALLATGQGLFRYRVALTDAAVALLRGQGESDGSCLEAVILRRAQ